MVPCYKYPPDQAYSYATDFHIPARAIRASSGDWRPQRDAVTADLLTADGRASSQQPLFHGSSSLASLHVLEYDAGPRSADCMGMLPLMAHAMIVHRHAADEL